MNSDNVKNLTPRQVLALFQRQLILERAVKLRDSHRKVYLALYEIYKPATASEVAEKIGQKRPNTHMRLLDLEEMGLVRSYRIGRKKVFEVIQL